MRCGTPPRIGTVASVGTLALALLCTPLARAETFYLARAIGEPAAPDTRAPTRPATPELPGLGTDTPPPAASTDSGSTWKWVAGIALTVALVALAKGGGSGDNGGGSASGGGNGGGGGNDSDDDDRRGGRGGLPSLPVLPGGR